MPEITLDPKQIRQDASEVAFGFKIGSTGLKVVHFANVLFNHVLESATDTAELGQFVYNGNLDASEIDDDDVEELGLDGYDAREYFDQVPPNQEIHETGQFLKIVLHNDEGMYAKPDNMAPNATSDWTVGDNYGARRLGRYIFELVKKSDGEHGTTIESNIRDGLTDHGDGISVLVRPIMHDSTEIGDRGMRWEGPQDDPFTETKISSTIVDGFARLDAHFAGYRAGSPDYLTRIVKFGTFGLYLYIANRYQEIGEVDSPDVPFPIVLNYTGSDTSDNPMLQASYNCYSRILSEVQRATRAGILRVLNDTPVEDWEDDEIATMIEERQLPELENRSTDQYEADFDQFAETYRSSTEENPLERLVEAFSTAIELEQFASNVYPPWKSERIIGRRMGFTKPLGRNANQYWFRPDPELLEVIVLSLIDRGEEVEITTFRDRLRENYGIIVGGTTKDRKHLNNYGIQMGSELNPENSPEKNAERFLDALVSLGYAQRFADGIAMVRSQEFGEI